MNNLNDLIKSLFKNFLIKNQPNINLDLFDDIVIVNYIIDNIKEFISSLSDSEIDKFDQYEELENFIDVTDAYLDGFKHISSEKLINFLYEVKNIKNDFETKQKISKRSSPEKSPLKKSPIKDESIRKSIDTSEINHLIEMFPKLDVKEISKVFTKYNKNTELAIDSLLMMDNIIKTKSSIEYQDEDLNDKEELKKRTVEKYGLLEVPIGDSANSSYKPPPPKWVSLYH